jgi:membrane protein
LKSSFIIFSQGCGICPERGFCIYSSIVDGRDVKSLRFSKEKTLAFLRHYFGGLYRRIGENHILLLSGGLAFSVIICIIPFVLIVIYLLGKFLQSASVSNQIDLFVETFIPYLSYSNYVKEIIHSRADELVAYKNVAGYIGIAGLFFAASGLFSSMRTGLNVIFKASGASPGYVGKLRDLGMVVLVILFFVLSIAILPVMEIIKDSARRFQFLQIFELSNVEGKLFFMMTILTIFMLFYTLYNLVPYKRLGWKVPAVGAFWAAVLWAVAKEIFGYYITNMASIKRVYGTYVLFAVVTFWIYYTSVIFLIGAQIGQLYRERIEKRRTE